MRNCLLFAVVALLSLAFAPAPFPRAHKQVKQPVVFLGTWQGHQRLVITQSRLTYFAGEAFQGYDLKFNPAAQPMTYDLHEDGSGREFVGIFRIDDTLTFCYNQSPAARPTSFDGPGKGQFTEVYKRVKP